MREIKEYSLCGVDKGDKIITILFVSKCVKVIILYNKDHADECDENIKGAIDFFYDKKLPFALEFKNNNAWSEWIYPDSYEYFRDELSEFIKDKLYKYIHKTLQSIYELKK